MMETRTRQHRWLLHLWGVVVLLAGLTACSSSEGTTDEPDDPNKPVPETPIAGGDWQTVSATGGTVTKDDITITFPGGTFDKDTKVAVTEVRKGETCGEYEVSKFYQVTMPATTAKSLTVKIKCAEEGDDLNAVIHAPATAISEQMEYYDDVVVESTFSNGEYTITLPAFENGGETENVSFSLGIANNPRVYVDDSGEVVATRSSSPEVKWHFENGKVMALLQQKNWKASNIAKHINDAIKTLQTLGFETSSSRDIPIKFDFLVNKKNEPVNGVMTQSRLSNKYNTVTLNNKFIVNLNQGDEWTEDNLSRTIIHELMHYFQAEYDPRSPYIKAVAGGDWLQLYESGAVWCEKLNSDGTFSAEFVVKYLPNFVRGLKNLAEIWEGKSDYAEMGYGLSTLLEYITRFRTSESFNDQSLIELYQQWHKDHAFLTYSGTSLDYIQGWVESSPHHSKLFRGNEYDKFILALALGDISSDINAKSFSSSTPFKIGDDGTYTMKDKCYPYGCFTQTATITNNTKNAEKGYYDNRELIFMQNESGVKTYLVHTNNQKEWQILGQTELGSSVIIDGKTLESFRTGDRYNKPFYVISTNQLNQQVVPSNVTIILREVEEPASVTPDSLTFPAEGGTQKVTIDKGTAKYIGADIPSSGTGWLSAKKNSDGTVSITATANEQEAARSGTVVCWASSKENPSDAEKQKLPVAVKQAGKDKGQDVSTPLVNGSVNMYYAIAWRWDVSFKPTDEGITVTPNGKGISVVIQQSGTDFHAEWKSEISFDIDDLSLLESGNAKLCNYKFEMTRDGWDANYGWSHSDWSQTTTKLTSNAPMPQKASGNAYWSFSYKDLSYYQKQAIHYDKWKKDAYAEPVEKTDVTETTEVTEGSTVAVSLNFKKK